MSLDIIYIKCSGLVVKFIQGSGSNDQWVRSTDFSMTDHLMVSREDDQLVVQFMRSRPKAAAGSVLTEFYTQKVIAWNFARVLEYTCEGISA